MDKRTLRKLETDKAIVRELAETFSFADEQAEPFINAGKRLARISEDFK